MKINYLQLLLSLHYYRIIFLCPFTILKIISLLNSINYNACCPDKFTIESAFLIIFVAYSDRDIACLRSYKKV